MNVHPLERVASVAEMLDYPGADFLAGARKLAEFEAGLRMFVVAMEAMTPEGREELHTATFDLNPACVPYAGLHLFGEENFKRGEFMSALAARQAETGFDARRELPDHLANLLRFLPACGTEEARELTEFCILGPLTKMSEALAAENPYRLLLEELAALLVRAFPGVVAAPSPLEKARAAGAGCPVPATGGCSCGPVSLPSPADDFLAQPVLT